MKESESKYKSVKSRLFFLSAAALKGNNRLPGSASREGSRELGEYTSFGCQVGSSSRGAGSPSGVETDPWTVEKNHMGELMAQLNS